MKWIIIGLIVIAVISGVLYFYVFTGIITVSSSRPLEAAVKIDRIEIGTTPIKHRVRSGTHQIMVYKEGFEPWQGEVEVTGTSPATITVRLRFLLKSEPSGAKVKINDKDVGVTDMAIDLLPGIYNFEFKMNGYQRVRFIAHVPQNASEPLPVANLVSAEAPPPEEALVTEKPPPPEYGSVQITSTPDAQVYLDGELRGETPLTIQKILVGSYVLKLSKEGYKDMRQTVYVNKGETTKVAMELKPEM